MYGDISDNDIAINARNREGGGVALYVESSLNILIRNDLMPAELELICIEIHKPKFRPLLITSWYRPPNSNAHIMEILENFLCTCS